MRTCPLSWVSFLAYVLLQHHSWFSVKQLIKFFYIEQYGKKCNGISYFCSNFAAMNVDKGKFLAPLALIVSGVKLKRDSYKWKFTMKFKIRNLLMRVMDKNEIMYQ